MQEYVI